MKRVPNLFFKLVVGLLICLHPGAAQSTDITYTSSMEDFLNPERGLYAFGQMQDGYSFSSLRNSGAALVYGEIYLPEFRTSVISSTRLEEVDRAFGRVRTAGVKVIPRVVYNKAIGAEDAPLDIVQAHIDQLAPVFESNRDVIVFIQAGFIGSWGEWHSSTNDLTSPGNRSAVINTMLEKFPEGLFIQLRQPIFKWDWAQGRQILPEEAFTGTGIARLGHHNDCFLASETDFGTYPSDNIELWKSRVAWDTQFTPMGGETCSVSDFSNCGFAIPEMERLHWSYLNKDYNGQVISELGPCWEEIRRRLGYRFELTEASLPDSISPGSTFDLTVRIRNSGFAPVYNERPVYLRLLSDDFVLSEERIATADPRRWLPGGEHIVTAQFVTPPGFSGSSVDLALWLPDEASILSADSRYSVRFANEAVWDDTLGHNLLGSVTVSASGCNSAPSIQTDGDTSDWGSIPPLQQDAIGDHGSSEVDLVAVSAINDAENLYLRIQSSSPYLFTDWLTSDHMGIFVDTDANAATGYSFEGIGSEFLLQGLSLFDQRGGGFNEGLLSVSAVGAPLVETTDVEIAIPLDAMYDDQSPLFPDPPSTIRLGLYGDSESYVTEERLPDSGALTINLVEPATSVGMASLTMHASPGGRILSPNEVQTIHECGSLVDIIAEPDSGYVFAGWTGKGVTDIDDSQSLSTKIELSGDSSLRATFEPLAGNLLHNGDFGHGLEGWNTLTTKEESTTAEVISNSLQLESLIGETGVWQQFSTGGAGKVVSVMGRWWSDPPAEESFSAEVLVINGDRLPASIPSERDGVADAVTMFRLEGNASYSGSFAAAEGIPWRTFFVAASDHATVLLRVLNQTGQPGSVTFDNLQVRGVAPAGTVETPPSGFAVKTMSFPHLGLSRLAEHPVTHQLYAIEDFARTENGPRLYRVSTDAENLASEFVIGVRQTGLPFESRPSNWASGLAFDSSGNLYISSQNGFIIKGIWNSLANTFSWISLPSLNLIPEVGNHGVGGLAIDSANQRMFINSGAIKHGTGNSDPEPDLPGGLNTRILISDLEGGNLRTWCRGIRHHFGITLRQDGTLFGVENSTDCPSAEEFNMLLENDHHGHPFRFGTDRSGSDDVLDLAGEGFVCGETPSPFGSFASAMANYGPDAVPQPGERGYLDGGLFYGLNPNSAPTGIDFYEPDLMDSGAVLFPEEYHGRAFIARFGQQVPDIPDAGYDIVSARVDEANGGFVCNAFLTGLARPVDLVCASNGRIYFLEYSGVRTGVASHDGTPSRLIEVTWTGQAANPTDTWMMR